VPASASAPGRPSRAAAAATPGATDGRPPFRPVSSLLYTAVEDSRTLPFVSTLASADMAPEDLNKTAKAAMLASMGAAKAAVSPHLLRGPDGR
jgi:hypothetical protein